jgi:hypothetical protein
MATDHTVPFGTTSHKSPGDTSIVARLRKAYVPADVVSPAADAFSVEKTSDRLPNLNPQPRMAANLEP